MIPTSDTYFGYYMVGSLIIGALYWLFNAMYGRPETVKVCDICRMLITASNKGQETADSIICADCIERMRWEDDGGQPRK